MIYSYYLVICVLILYTVYNIGSIMKNYTNQQRKKEKICIYIYITYICICSMYIIYIDSLWNVYTYPTRKAYGYSFKINSNPIEVNTFFEK